MISARRSRRRIATATAVIDPVGRRLLRAVAVTVAFGSVLGGMYAVSAGSSAEAATRGTDSSITVEWGTGNVAVGADATATAAEVQAAQPDHAALTSDGAGDDAGSGHWDDFKNLSVTVEKTADLQDEAITITASGMGATAFQAWEGSASNYLQIMQCWGEDPNAADFADTCQFGSWSLTSGDRKAGETMFKAIGWGTQTRGQFSASGERRFTAVTGQVNKPFETMNEGLQNGLSTFFTASSSNELPFVRIGADGKAQTQFEVQSATSQPYLGCGSGALAGERCWAVIVPRGTHSGELAPGETLSCVPAVYGAKPYGEPELQQRGSPISADCSYWNDRVVVPLDFRPLEAGCAAGSVESRVVGSELLSAAMSSWQRGLCAASGTAYALSTNSGDLARGQLLTGQSRMSIVANPVTADSIGLTDPGLLDGTDFAYAPVANTGLVISYVAETALKGTVYTDLKLTPRLLAKALTQSYAGDVPMLNGIPLGSSALLDEYWPNRPQNLQEDPEFLALNDLPVTNDILPIINGTFVVTGPYGEDVVETLWRYIQADADAVAFLRGEPDPWGNTINPYYLPATHPDARGGGLDDDLSTQPIDAYLKADQSVAPAPSVPVFLLDYEGQTLSSVDALPYSSSLASNAARVLRADTRLVTDWDPTKTNTAGEPGAFVAVAPQLAVNGRFLAGPVDAPTAARYGLTTMQLPLPVPNPTTAETVRTARTFVAPDDASFAAALAAAEDADGDGVATLDFTRLPAGAYPLTTTLYGAVDVASEQLEDADRSELASLLDYAAGNGNVRGSSAGQLPDGYVPLTASQIAQNARVAALVRSGPAQDSEPAVAPSSATTTGAAPVDTSAAGALPTSAATVSTAAADEAETTGAVAGSVGLGGALISGVAGLAAAPFLLRRRNADG